ncbi:MAG: hypothetical protein STHCBS139747_007336 [Sporothrix thermara]
MADFVTLPLMFGVRKATSASSAIHSKLAGKFIIYDAFALIIFGLIKMAILIYTNESVDSSNKPDEA